MIAIMGKSGAGKSTLLNIIGCIFTLTSGEYLFNNNLSPQSEHEMANFRRDNIGFILQHSSLINNKNIFYNIALPLIYKNIEKKKIKERVNEIARSLGIFDKLEMFPQMLSGGECQRAVIARAIITKPSIILADEPTSSLDDENKYEILDILKELNQENMTIIIVTHDDKIANMCDRKIVIDNGKVLYNLSK